ncbi:MAG: hypothetical protein WAK67_10735, partial [Xanthobacteraceae bacterium]
MIEIKFFCWLDQTKILVTYTFGYWSEVLLFPCLSYVRHPHVAGASQRMIFVAVHLFDLRLT